MATDQDFVEFITDQIGPECEITYRKMFGEYGIYSKGKIVALACDNQLFVKPTDAGRSYIGDVVEAPPYPGAKPSFLIEDRIDDGEWLTRLISLTEASLPPPKPKSKFKSRSGAKIKSRSEAKSASDTKSSRGAGTKQKRKPKKQRP